MKNKIFEAVPPQLKQEIERVINGMTFTKNFRSATAFWHAGENSYDADIISKPQNY
jgi:hypothetical protein